MAPRPSLSRPRRLALALAAGAAALTLAACSGGASGDTGEASGSGGGADHGELNLQLSWIKNEEFAGEFFADSKGYFEEAGFSEVVMTAGPSTGTAELLSGSADVALSDSVAVGTVVANEEAPLKIIGATFQANPFTILSLADGGNIAAPEDMIGKRIGVQASNTSLFEALLAANDIAASQVTVVPVDYDPSVLVNGDVDGFVAYITNEAITVSMQGLATTTMDFAENGLPFVAETFTVTDQTIAEDREKLKAFLVAEIKGWTDQLADPEEGARLAVEEYGADLELDMEKAVVASEAQNELVVSPDTEEHGLFVITEDLQEQTIATLQAVGLDIEASDLFDLSLLEEVYEENPDLVDYAG
ncbi:ABC transporter substrate-binding protein [Naasia sp. SYSU D00948]|uniref:ABC transporter substrate-binding protein n=1 Tax=Naasia sp. SYSU D00948 TaxID=2817379 RepID=UPI001B303C36|nr:ABC transporter substrate-binding protein [Naasia sp. SYSU D00948]